MEIPRRQDWRRRAEEGNQNFKMRERIKPECPVSRKNRTNFEAVQQVVKLPASPSLASSHVDTKVRRKHRQFCTFRFSSKNTSLGRNGTKEGGDDSRNKDRQKRACLTFENEFGKEENER